MFETQSGGPDTVDAPVAGGMEDTGRTQDLARKSGKRMYEAPDLKQIKQETTGDTRRCTRITGAKEFQVNANMVYFAHMSVPHHYLKMRDETKTLEGRMQWSADRVNGDHKYIVGKILKTLSNQKALKATGIIGPLPPSLFGINRDDLSHRMIKTVLCTAKACAWYVDGPRHVPPEVFGGLVDKHEVMVVDCMEYLQTLIAGLKVVEAIAIDDSHGHQHDAITILQQAGWPYSQPIRKLLMDLDVNDNARRDAAVGLLRNIFSGHVGTVTMLENGFNVFEDAARHIKNKLITAERSSPTQFVKNTNH